MPSSVNLTHNTFVCTRCSGILRDYQYRIKGISMSSFSEDEVAALASGGNTAHNNIYMANFGDREILPNPSMQEKMKEFMNSK